MLIVVTRLQSDGERTAEAVRALGHDVLLAPLMTVQPVAADLHGLWSAIVVTSANAAAAIVENRTFGSVLQLPMLAVGRRSAEAARRVGFMDVVSADGDVHDLIRLISTRPKEKSPMLYLAGEQRAIDLIAELSARGIVAELRVVYRAVPAPFPSTLVEALKAGKVDAVLHFSRRSAANYVAGAKAARIAERALAVQHFCLSAQVAEPLAGAGRIAIADQPEEAALMALLPVATA